MGFSVSNPTTGVLEACASQGLWVNEGGLESQGSASPLCYPQPSLLLLYGVWKGATCRESSSIPFLLLP